MTSYLWRPPPLGPGGHPFRGWRIVPFLLTFVAFAVNALILLSDRAPGVFSRVSLRIDAGMHRAAGAAGVDVPGTTVRVPQSDFGVHVVIWGVAALLLGLAAWSWVTLFLASAAAFASSVVLELAQSVYSQRNFEFHDIAGNAVGVLLGTGLVVAFFAVWTLSTRPSAPRR